MRQLPAARPPLDRNRLPILQLLKRPLEQDAGTRMPVVAAFLYRDGARVRSVAINERCGDARDKSEFVWINRRGLPVAVHPLPANGLALT